MQSRDSGGKAAISGKKCESGVSCVIS